MDEDREEVLFKRLEAHMKSTVPNWEHRVVVRSNEVRARMIDRSDPILVQLVVAEVLRAELRRRLMDNLPFEDVDSDETEHIIEGFGKAFAQLNQALRKDGKL